MVNADSRVRLVSARLVLREFDVADEHAMHAYASDPQVTRFMDWGPNSVDDTRTFLAETMAKAAEPARSTFDLAVVHGASGHLIGSAAIVTSTTGEERTGLLGYVFHPDFWSKGYATEAAALMMKFGFDRLDLRRIDATCHPDNTASARVLEKIGMRYQRRLPDHLFIRGAWRDSLLYSAERAASAAWRT